jgi:hypothetical protein
VADQETVSRIQEWIQRNRSQATRRRSHPGPAAGRPR